MKIYYADLHVHIGRADNGAPVKITASDTLTFAHIVEECAERKGIDIVGIIDCASPPVLADIEAMVEGGLLVPLPGGGLSYQGKTTVTVILGAEIELAGPQGGSAHFLAYCPTVAAMRELSRYLSVAVTNISLSSQRAALEIGDVERFVHQLGGLFLPAHGFTPFKSVYGNCVERLSEICADFDGLELGLSADTQLADRFGELQDTVFLSNSDAHSLPKIAREYNAFQLHSPDFDHIALALRRKQGNRIAANYGLDPRLGKYHRTFCETCSTVVDSLPPVMRCPRCGGERVVVGVLDRIVAIADRQEPLHPAHRPPYCYQIPLEFIPGVGSKTLEKLLAVFGTEMNILHQASYDALRQVVSSVVATRIIEAREGRLALSAGGGGRYGRVASR